MYLIKCWNIQFTIFFVNMKRICRYALYQNKIFTKEMKFFALIETVRIYCKYFVNQRWSNEETITQSFTYVVWSNATSYHFFDDQWFELCVYCVAKKKPIHQPSVDPPRYVHLIKICPTIQFPYVYRMFCFIRTHKAEYIH